MRIGIANDTPMALEFLRRIVMSTGAHEVAWEAHDGAEAVRKCARDTPDLVLMDLVMPAMNGVEATRRIMQVSPCAILVVTASPRAHRFLAFDAIAAGAVDVVGTPGEWADGRGADLLLKKIVTIGKLIGLSAKRTVRPRPAGAAPAASSDLIIGIGASTGGPAAVVEVLSALPAGLPASIVVVLHVDVQFARGMAEWMDGLVDLPVLIADEGERPRPGAVLLAATNEHLVLGRNQTFHYTKEPRNYPYRPSADAFFQSLVSFWRGAAVGVLLTGMGRDGAKGLMAMRRKGWHTIAQDEDSSMVYGMPKAAAAIGAAREVLPLHRIGAALANLAGRGTIAKEDRHAAR